MWKLENLQVMILSVILVLILTMSHIHPLRCTLPLVNFLTK